MSARINLSVGNPTAAVIRRTCRSWPSLTTGSSHAVGMAFRTRMGGGQPQTAGASDGDLHLQPLLLNIRQCRSISAVRTVAETPIFQRYAADIWTVAEREEFIAWIAVNPEAGDLIKGSGGCRKVRWAASGRGKSGGARVIYFNVSDQTIWLLIAYTKGKFDNLPTSFLAELKQGVEDAL